MGARRATGWTIAAAALLLATGCAQGQPPAGTGTAPSASSQATTTAGPTADGQQGQAPGALQVKTIPLGSTADAAAKVVAKLPIDSYAGEPGQEFIFDASQSEGSIDKYEWDLDGDGTFDQTTTTPVLKHTYTAPFDGQLVLRVTGPLGSTDTLRVPLHVGGSDPRNARLAPPTDVRIESVSPDGTEVKLAWKSDDPAADSWGIAVNGVPVARVAKSERSATVTDVRRSKDVLFEVFAITADGRLGERAGTTLPAS